MLTEIYIEAFDEEQADQVWEAWHTREIDDQIAWIAWVLIVERLLYTCDLNGSMQHFNQNA